MVFHVYLVDSFIVCHYNNTTYCDLVERGFTMNIEYQNNVIEVICEELGCKYCTIYGDCECDELTLKRVGKIWECINYDDGSE